MGKTQGGASSSSSSNPAAGRRPPLPVMALREKIVAKVQENRVTLIVGDTGCGKSSQVPQFLLEENVEPILCTQPRRFAVVVIARMVAKARNCEVGQEVGYHIGHSNVSDLGSNRSKIVFKTAGVVLEQMRDKGLIALKYKVIILDEVHERSVESDLLLACVKLLMMKNNDMRVVLMSATADITRYKDYFKDLGRGERVEVIAIPNVSQQSSIFQRKVLYLDQVAEHLGMDLDSVSSTCCSEWVPGDADIKPELHEIIHKLVMHIHISEPDIEKSILVFLPTYYSLEQQWVRLRHLSLLFKIHILHRSIDTNQALLAMKACQSHRKVILATNIAESSVTIPGVAYVIDSCRSLQIFWDPGRKADFSKLVWVSKSQAEQRKGRTGRTCDGEIYRCSWFAAQSLKQSMIPKDDLKSRTVTSDMGNLSYAIFAIHFDKYHLCQHLTLFAEGFRGLTLDLCHTAVLLQKALDPPEMDIVEDALSLLVKMNALEKPLSSRGRYEPTFYGRLLDSLPLSFDASILALKFGQVGILREGIIISILMDVQPPPIYHPFGNQNLYVENYFDSSSCKPIAKKEASLMANLCAFQFWERVFKDKHRLERLKHVVNVDEFSYSEVLFSKLEEEWCSFHNLIQTSLHTLSEIYEETVEILHRFRPAFLAKIKIPCYFEPYTFKHTCILQSEPAADLDALTLEDENLDTATRQKCITLPYVAPDDFGATSVSEKLKSLVKEMRMQYVEDTSGFLPNTATVSQANEPAICKFFAIRACNKGDLCHYSHSYQSERPLCRFFHTFQGCRNGNACFFLHDYSSSGRRASNFCLQEDATTSADSFLQLLPTMSYEYILILNDNDLFFSINLAQIYDANKIIATTHRSYSEFEESLGIRVLCDVAEPWYAITKSNEISIPWEQVRCILWFADIEDDAARHYHLLQDLFRHLAVKILADTLFDIRVIITINNVKFAQLQVEKLARECFFILTESFCFDESSFGNFSGSKKTTRLNNHISLPVSYVFELYPPTDLQFGDYSAVLQKGLYRQ